MQCFGMSLFNCNFRREGFLTVADKPVDRQFSLSLEQLSSSFLYAIPVTDTRQHVAYRRSVKICKALIMKCMQVNQESGIYCITIQFRIIYKDAL